MGEAGGLCLHCGIVPRTETFVKHLFRQSRSGRLSKYVGLLFKSAYDHGRSIPLLLLPRFLCCRSVLRPPCPNFRNARHLRPASEECTGRLAAHPPPDPRYRWPAGWRPGRRFPAHARHFSLIRPFSWFVGPPRPRGIYFARRFPGSFRQARYRLILLAGEFLYSGIAECVFRITAKEASP
jgi:hypothetical protein